MNGLTDDLELENEMDEALSRGGIEELVKVVGRRVNSMSTNCTAHNRRLTDLENKGKKQTAAISGVSATIGGAVIVLAEFMRRLV